MFMLRRLRTFSLVAALAAALTRLAIAQAPPPDPTAPLFDDTVLHEIRLSINSRDWQALKDHFQDNTYYPADFRWNNQTVPFIGVRSRGSGSPRPNKPSLRLDFNRYVDGQ